MSAEDKPRWAPRNKANVIPKEEYVKLRALAEANGIALAGVKKFDGSAQVVKDILDSLISLQKEFPAVRDERYKLTLSFDKTMGDEDFAVTRGKIISLNEDAYRD